MQAALELSQLQDYLFLQETDKQHCMRLGISRPHIIVDMQGRTVDFKNTLIIMTSNVGSSVIEKGGGGLGFQLDTSEEDSSYNRIKTLVNEELKQYFRPEFLNRRVAAVCMLHKPSIAAGLLPVKPGHCIGIFSGL